MLLERFLKRVNQKFFMRNVGGLGNFLVVIILSLLTVQLYGEGEYGVRASLKILSFISVIETSNTGDRFIREFTTDPQGDIILILRASSPSTPQSYIELSYEFPNNPNSKTILVNLDPTQLVQVLPIKRTSVFNGDNYEFKQIRIIYL